MKSLTYPVVPLYLQLLLVINCSNSVTLSMVVVRAVSVSLIWSFLAFISLFPNSLLLIWLMSCDKVPFSTFLSYLTNTRFLGGSLPGCHLKLLHRFYPFENSHHGSVGVPFLPWGRAPSQHSFGCMGCLAEASWVPSCLRGWRKDLNVFDLLWQYRNIWV